MSSLLALPGAVAATREDAGSAWRSGADRQAAHPIWLLTTGDAETRRHGHSATVSHDAPIAVGATLADPALSRWADVRRAVCVGGLEHGWGDGPISARVVAATMLRLDWAYRWCSDRGMQRLGDFGPAELRDFGVDLRSSDTVLALVDLDERLASITERELAGVLGGPEAPLAVADAPALARRLGVTCASIHSPSRMLQRTLARRLGLAEPNAVSLGDNGGPGLSLYAISGYLQIWSLLQTAAKLGWIAEGPSFSPVGRGGTRATASRFGAEAGRTPTLAPRIFFGLLCAAARVVLQAAPPIASPIGRAAIVLDGERGCVQREVRTRMTAVAVLIGGLSGRRGGEISSVRHGAVTDTANGHKLQTLIEKSGGTVTRIPIPALVAAGVGAMESMAEGNRPAAGGWLFRVTLPWGRVIELDPAADLAAFAVAAGLDSSAADLASHQLRRGMSILWEFGYRAGTPAGLARALRHRDEATGEIYVSEAEAGRVTALRDEMAAAVNAAIASIGPDLRRRLLALLQRFRHPNHSLGTPPGADRYGPFPLALLEEWASTLGKEAPPPEALASLGVSIGSQAEASDGRPLLEVARAHVAKLVEAGMWP